MEQGGELFVFVCVNLSAAIKNRPVEGDCGAFDQAIRSMVQTAILSIDNNLR